MAGAAFPSTDTLASSKRARTTTSNPGGAGGGGVHQGGHNAQCHTKNREVLRVDPRILPTLRWWISPREREFPKRLFDWGLLVRTLRVCGWAQPERHPRRPAVASRAGPHDRPPRARGGGRHQQQSHNWNSCGLGFLACPGDHSTPCRAGPPAPRVSGVHS